MSNQHVQNDWPRPWTRSRVNAQTAFKAKPLPFMAELHHAVTAANDEGQRVPCTGRTEWTSEDREVRAEAARLCSGCPVLTECYVAAREHKERFGVWGGQDLTRGLYQRRAYRAAEQEPDTPPTPAPAPRQDGTPTRRSSDTN